MSVCIQGEDLHDLLISVGDTGTENVCGVFEGPGQDSDEILIFCAFNTIGRYVMATIISKPGETDLMQMCETSVRAIMNILIVILNQIDGIVVFFSAKRLTLSYIALMFKKV